MKQKNYKKNDTIFYLSDDFNLPLDNKIIKNCSKFKEIQFGYEFNQNINKLPERIKKIIFKCNSYSYLRKKIKYYCGHRSSATKFNHKINTLPKFLKSLFIYSVFNFKINYLPNMLNSLIIGDKFNKNIFYLSSSLNMLDLGNHNTFVFSCYNKKLRNLPNSINNLSVKRLNDENVRKLPLKLNKIYAKSFECNKNKCFLPINLNRLEICIQFIYDIEDTVLELKFNNNLQELLIYRNYDYSSDEMSDEEIIDDVNSIYPLINITHEHYESICTC